jgi:hypothetical protein
MKSGASIALVVVALVAAVGGGYWLGQAGKAQPEHAATGAVAGPAAEATKKQPRLLYYRNPMGLADTSPVPKKDPMGMDYIAVYLTAMNRLTRPPPRPTRSTSARKRCKNLACAPSPPACAGWTGRSALPGAWSPTSAASP